MFWFGVLALLVGLMFMLLGTWYHLWTYRNHHRILRFMVKAWRQRNGAREELAFHKRLNAEERERSRQEVARLAREARKLWDAYEVQEALQLARQRLLEQRPSVEEIEADVRRVTKVSPIIPGEAHAP